MAVSALLYDPEGCFLGFEPRMCGEHRTVGSHRAWCFHCVEWCYPASPCVRCNPEVNEIYADKDPRHGTCPVCGRPIEIKLDGTVRGHGPAGNKCPGSWERPK